MQKEQGVTMMQLVVSLGIGDRLRRLRRNRLLTQHGLAERAGVSHVTIARIETGQVEPRIDTLRKLAKALDIEPTELLGE